MLISNVSNILPFARRFWPLIGRYFLRLRPRKKYHSKSIALFVTRLRNCFSGQDMYRDWYHSFLKG